MKVDVIITSCGRHDLLDRTLHSLFKYNSESINDVYVYEDSDNDDAFWDTVMKYPVQHIFGTSNRGQIYAIDELMSNVTTDFYLHLEDDWECLEFGFIPEAIATLRDENVACVIGRGRSAMAMNGHPNKDGIPLKNWNGWSGWAYAPTLHKLSDYEALVKYGKHVEHSNREPWLSEKAIGNIIMRNRYSRLTEKAYFRHIGNDRSTLKQNR